MPEYELKALAAAKEKLALAKSKLKEMQGASDLDRLAQLWIEFLTEHHRVFLRLRKATEHGAGKGWFDRIIAEQRGDELLKYLMHARDAAEHGIENITARKPKAYSLRFKPEVPGQAIFVEHMEINSGPSGVNVRVDPETYKKLTVEFHPESIQLMPVRDRGSVYAPPTQHLGKSIVDANPIAVAELGISYLEAKLAEAELNYVR